MSLQPSKSDQDFTKNLIANQDVLLSPTMEQQNDQDASLDFFSFINNDTMLNIMDQSNNLNMSSMINNPNEELDCNLFEILRADDPEVASLLETLNRPDFNIDFLPQISVNTTNKVLNESVETLNHEISNVVAKIENESLYQTVQLKTECESPIKEIHESDEQNTSTRASLRLLNRKDTRNRTDNSKQKTSKQLRVETENRLNLKRKRSIDDDDDSSFNSSENDSIDFGKNYVAKHNDNSVDFESDDHIYYDDDDDDTATNGNDYFNSDDDQDDNEKDFANYVRNYNKVNRGRVKRLDPTKKESNKEAATRYRLKKLSEKERLFETRMCLESENNEVKRKIEMAQTEITYLKNLLVQMLLTKGVLDNKL